MSNEISNSKVADLLKLQIDEAFAQSLLKNNFRMNLLGKNALNDEPAAI